MCVLYGNVGECGGNASEVCVVVVCVCGVCVCVCGDDAGVEMCVGVVVPLSLSCLSLSPFFCC